MCIKSSLIFVLNLFQTTSMDLGFVQVCEEITTLKPHLEVKYGRVQSIYLNPEMKPPPEISEPLDAESNPRTPEFGQDEKGKTYVVNDADNSTNDAKETDDDNTKDQNKSETQGEHSNNDKTTLADPPLEFDEQTLDEEVSAVTGKALMDQKPLAEDRASVGTLTPDI